MQYVILLSIMTIGGFTIGKDICRYKFLEAPKRLMIVNIITIITSVAIMIVNFT